jgi:hypothetical protein
MRVGTKLGELTGSPTAIEAEMDNFPDLQPPEDPVFPRGTINIAVAAPFADSMPK